VLCATRFPLCLSRGKRREIESTLVNYLDLGKGLFEFVADANPFKEGKYMPGQRIPIRHPDRLAADQPDYVLLLVWNFAREVMRQQTT